jgi:hypothetical protein
MEIKKQFLISIFATILVLFSCKKEEEKIEPEYEYDDREVYEEPAKIDFYNFKHYIDSDYAFDIKITNIRVVEHKGALEIEKEKYGKPEKISGTSVVIEFDIKNPYSRIMRIPFPEYYQISSNEFERLEGYSYSRKLDAYAGFASNVENKKGIPLNSIGHWNDDSISRELIVDFEPNETKSFVIEFTEPFPSTIEKIIFIGFNKHFKKQVDDTLNLSKEELESYLADKSTEYGLVIDLKSKKIIDLITYNK